MSTTAPVAVTIVFIPSALTAVTAASWLLTGSGRAVADACAWAFEPPPPQPVKATMPTTTISAIFMRLPVGRWSVGR